MLLRTVIVTECSRQSHGTLKAISNATVSMVSESPVKTSRTLYKERRRFREGWSTKLENWQKKQPYSI